MSEPKISIITVCFNSAKTIRKTIESVMNQTYRNIEYIIIDGGSTDGTIEIIREYEEHIAYWISESDNGLYHAMNKGISKASGDIIGIINSDDWYDTCAVERVVACFEKENINIVHGNMMIVSESGSALYRNQSNPTEEEFSFYALGNHPTFFVRSEVYKKHGVFDCQYQIAADYDLLLRFQCAGISFYYLPMDLVYFRLGGVSNTKRMWKCVKETKKISIRILQGSNISNLNKKKYFALIDVCDKQYRLQALKNFMKRRLDRVDHSRYLKTLFISILDDKKKYVIFGTGAVGTECYGWFKNDMDLIEYFVDNSVLRQKEQLDNMPIKNPTILSADKNRIKILIATTDYQDAIQNQLANMNFVAGKDYLSFGDFQNLIISQYIKDKIPGDFTTDNE